MSQGFVILYVNCCTNFNYNFNPCGIFEKMTKFFKILTKTRLINGGHNVSEINVQENMSSNVRNILKFAKISRKDLLCTKM